MDFVYPNLYRELRKANISISDLARKLNISDDTAECKIRGEIPWLLPEAVGVCQLLNTSDVKFLFLRLDNNS